MLQHPHLNKKQELYKGVPSQYLFTKIENQQRDY